MNISALQKEQILNLINYQSQRLKKQEELSKSHNRIISDLEILAGTLKLVDSDFDFFADLIKCIVLILQKHENVRDYVFIIEQLFEYLKKAVETNKIDNAEIIELIEQSNFKNLFKEAIYETNYQSE